MMISLPHPTQTRTRPTERLINPNGPDPTRQGVTNEHFIVWMRTAGLPTFRKLYGRIDQDIPAGTALSFVINPGFEVVSFGGKKHLGMLPSIAECWWVCALLFGK